MLRRYILFLKKSPIITAILAIAVFVLIIWKKIGKSIDFKEIRKNW